MVAALLIAAPEPFNAITFSGYRNWAFTLLFAAIYLASCANSAKKAECKFVWALLAGLAIGLAYYTDLFTGQLLPGIVILLIGWFWRARCRALTGLALALGYSLGSIPRIAAAMKGPGLREFSLYHLAHSWQLFWQSCLPYMCGSKLILRLTATAGRRTRPTLQSRLYRELA